MKIEWATKDITQEPLNIVKNLQTETEKNKIITSGGGGGWLLRVVVKGAGGDTQTRERRAEESDGGCGF